MLHVHAHSSHAAFIRDSNAGKQAALLKTLAQCQQVLETTGHGCSGSQDSVSSVLALQHHTQDLPDDAM